MNLPSGITPNDLKATLAVLAEWEREADHDQNAEARRAFHIAAALLIHAYGRI